MRPDRAIAGALAACVGIPLMLAVGGGCSAQTPPQRPATSYRPERQLVLPPPSDVPYSIGKARATGICHGLRVLTAVITPAGLVISACAGDPTLETASVSRSEFRP